MAPYRDKAEYYTLFDQLTALNPSLMSSQRIGYTVNGFTLKVYKIGNPNGGKVLIDGCIHGKSWAASELLWIYVNWLLAGSPEATRILERNYTLIVPCINVDVIWYGRPNANRVDLNRNFETNWELGNPDPTAYDYRGPAPLSEPETQAMRSLFERERPRIYLNHHTWGGDYWGGFGTPDQTAFNNSVNNLYQELAQQRGVTPYPYQSGGLGPGYATSDAAVFGGSNSFAIEVFKSGEYDVYSPPPLSELQTYWFNRVLAVYIAISQAVEIITPLPECFIATVAYGTPLAAELNVLRGFRDNFMALTRIGRSLTSFYNKVSPPVAKAMMRRQRARKAVRMILRSTIIVLKKLSPKKHKR